MAGKTEVSAKVRPETEYKFIGKNRDASFLYEVSPDSFFVKAGNIML